MSADEPASDPRGEPSGAAPKRVTVAVTGAAGYLGRALIDALCASGAVERVVGFDLVPPRFEHDRFSFEAFDVRDPGLEARLHGIDVLVHLAFVMDPIRDEADMRDVNVNGSQNAFRCAGRAGVSKVVYTSSATVYGAHPDNEVPLTEESPLRANLDFSYPAHKLEVEYVVREVRDQFPDVIFTVFRPCIVFGSRVDNAWSHVMELPVLPGVRGHHPPFQFVHEDDVAAALEFAVTHDLDGIYNLAPDGWISMDAMIGLLGKRRVDVGEPVLFALWDALWSAGLAEAPAGMLHYVMHPWVVDNAKLSRAGFTPARSNREAFEEGTERIRHSVRIGKARVGRSGLVRTAAAGAGLAGAAATVLAVRSRRSA